MKLIRLLCVAATVIALTACASGPTFTKPDAEKLVLGKSTRADVLQSQNAKPTSETEATVNGEKVHETTYFAAENPKFWGMLIERRFGTYTFYNEVLVGNVFTSSYSDESTKFDTDKIASIEKGKTTRSEVIALLGNPSGEVIYPVISDKKGRGLVYSYNWGRFAGMFTSFSSNLLVVSLDENNIVTNISFKQNGVEKSKG